MSAFVRSQGVGGGYHLDELGSDVHEAEVGLENLRNAGLLNFNNDVFTGL